MKVLLVVLVWLLGVSVVGAHGNHEPHELNTQKISITKIDSVFYELEKQKIESSFVSFKVDVNSEDLSLQFSVKNDKVGLDWLLLAKRNVADKEKFVSYAESKGFTVSKKSANGIAYLRVEVDDSNRLERVPNQAENSKNADNEHSLLSLCQGILVDIYGLSLTDEVSLFAKKVILDEVQL